MPNASHSKINVTQYSQNSSEWDYINFGRTTSFHFAEVTKNDVGSNFPPDIAMSIDIEKF